MTKEQIINQLKALKQECEDALKAPGNGDFHTGYDVACRSCADRLGGIIEAAKVPDNWDTCDLPWK